MTAVAQTDTSIFQLFVILGIVNVILKLDALYGKHKKWKQAAWYQRLRYHFPLPTGLVNFMWWLLDNSWGVAFWMLVRIFADGWDPLNPATVPPIQTDPYANLFFTAFAFTVIYYFLRVAWTNAFFTWSNGAAAFLIFVLWGTQVVNFVLWIVLYTDGVALSPLPRTFLIVLMVTAIVCVAWLTCCFGFAIVATKCGDRHGCFKQHFAELKLKAKAKLEVSMGSNPVVSNVGFPGFLAMFNQPAKSHSS